MGAPRNKKQEDPETDSGVESSGEFISVHQFEWLVCTFSTKIGAISADGEKSKIDWYDPFQQGNNIGKASQNTKF